MKKEVERSDFGGVEERCVIYKRKKNAPKNAFNDFVFVKKNYYAQDTNDKKVSQSVFN